MRLSEMLIYADIEQLSEIAKRYQCQCSSNSKHELIQSIISHSYRDDIMEAQLFSMPNEQKHLLSLLLFDVNKKYSKEELKAKIKYCNFKVIEDKKVKRKKQSSPSISIEEIIIKKLKDEGWLFKEQSFSQHLLYQIPEDKQALFRRLITKQMKASLQFYDVVSIARDESGYFVEDIKLLLNYINKIAIPINEIQLMNKRTVHQILSNFYVNEDIPGKNAWKFGYGKKFGEYPERFAMLYQFCVASGWIEEHDRLILTERGEEVAQGELLIDHTQLIMYWLTIYKKPIPNLRAITYFLLMTLNEWAAIEQVQEQLKPFIKMYYFDSEDAILHKRILKMLLHFGVLIIGQNEEQTLLVKLTTYGRQWLMNALSVDGQGKYIPSH